MSSQNWLNQQIYRDVDEDFNEFYTSFLYIFDICFPKRISYIKDDSHVKWLRDETVQPQEQLKELYLRTRNFPDNKC